MDITLPCAVYSIDGARHPAQRINLGARDASALGAFYARLLGWRVTVDEGDWVVVAGDDDAHISVETDQHYQPPVWPSEPGRPPIQLHLDIQTTDLDAACRHAQECGATMHPHQPQQDVRVMVDPEGHPFCLFVHLEAVDDA